MLLIIGTVIILVYTIICLIKVYRNREQLKNMTGMAIAMILGMVSSTAIGLILGIMFKGDLTASTITAMNFALIVGILVGKPISLLAMGEGVAGGVMGGMMGAMIGDMIPSNSYSFMLVYIVIFSIVSYLFIIHLVDTKAGISKENKLHHPWTAKAIISVTVMFTLVTLVTLGYLDTEIIGDENKLEAEERHHH
ncbi:hypothetical protein [Oceanobacillus damuensis]|uniref:hypothetical protein n=1 Tax=Oceanobacillus damuensis TaxID=937928 RepID=UPI00082F0F65|nr:hypothetical protein [Oceanobacillus damuensis]